MSNSNETKAKGVGVFNLPTLLFLVFLTLKLGGWGIVADWSWWWVTSPLWIAAGGMLFLLVVGMALVFITGQTLGHSDEKEDV